MIKCKDCRFFRFTPNDPDAEGKCQRYAPKPLNNRETAYWPDVQEEDGCGEGLEREKPAPHIETLPGNAMINDVLAANLDKKPSGR